MQLLYNTKRNKWQCIIVLIFQTIPIDWSVVEQSNTQAIHG